MNLPIETTVKSAHAMPPRARFFAICENGQGYYLSGLSVWRVGGEWYGARRWKAGKFENFGPWQNACWELVAGEWRQK